MNTHEALIRHAQKSQWEFVESGETRSDVLFVPLKGLTSHDATKIEIDGNMTNVLPGYGAFIENNKWGMTRGVGPCSIAVITGMDNVLWLGHIQPKQGLPYGVLDQARQRKFTHTQLNITLVGAHPNRFSSPKDAQHSREAQVSTIQRQIYEAGLRSKIYPYWNTGEKEWLVTFVHAYKGCAEIFLANEIE